MGGAERLQVRLPAESHLVTTFGPMKENDNNDAAGILGLMYGIAGTVVIVLLAVIVSTIFGL